MILSELNEYYHRKAAAGGSDIAPPGYEWKELPFIIVISKDGMPVAIQDTREGEGKARRAKRYLVPRGEKKGSGIKANLLWENIEYALGILRGATDPQAGEKCAKRHEAFKARTLSLECDDEGLNALKCFLKKADKQSLLTPLAHFSELVETTAPISFSLAGDTQLISERSPVKRSLKFFDSFVDDEELSVCLVSGQRAPSARLHFAIKGVRNAQSSGADIVSFNKPAFKSYGKSQGSNAPVSKAVVTAYVTALNNLLERDSRQKMQVGDATTVFWSQRESFLEENFRDIFDEPPKDNPSRNVSALRSLYSAAESGVMSHNAEDNKFFVLGLAPNASRISIRYWHVDTVAALSKRILQHFEDINIVHREADSEVLSLFRLLVSTAAQGKSENIPPNLAGETMRSILFGLPYPRTLLGAVVRRIRAEQTKTITVSHPRAGLLKACLNRDARFYHQDDKEIMMSLDETNTNPGYCLGRLFAVLEKIQSDASPGLNATIRDRYYGAASGTPVAVFGSLMRMKNHHLAKLNSDGSRVYYEKLLANIFANVQEFPSHLSLADQGRFAIGYYHQNFSLYSKKDSSQSAQTKEA